MVKVRGGLKQRRVNQGENESVERMDTHRDAIRDIFEKGKE